MASAYYSLNRAKELAALCDGGAIGYLLREYSRRDRIDEVVKLLSSVHVLEMAGEVIGTATPHPCTRTDCAPVDIAAVRSALSCVSSSLCAEVDNSPAGIIEARKHDLALDLCAYIASLPRVANPVNSAKCADCFMGIQRRSVRSLERAIKCESCGGTGRSAFCTEPHLMLSWVRFARVAIGGPCAGDTCHSWFDQLAAFVRKIPLPPDPDLDDPKSGRVLRRSRAVTTVQGRVERIILRCSDARAAIHRSGAVECAAFTPWLPDLSEMIKGPRGESALEIPECFEAMGAPPSLIAANGDTSSASAAFAIDGELTQLSDRVRDDAAREAADLLSKLEGRA